MLKNTIIILYAIVIVVMAMASFFPQQTADSLFYGTWWFSVLWAMLTAAGIAWLVKQRMKRPVVLLLHLSLVIILAGALLTHLTSMQPTMHLRTGVPTTQLDNGTRLPFAITLQHFSITYHAGTSAPLDYISTVSIEGRDAEGGDAEGHETAVISMNSILSCHNYRFYQSGYDPDQQGTYLAVNSDPYGIPVTYAGYCMLFLSLILMLINPQGRFRKALKWLANADKAALSLLLMLILPLASVTVASADTLQETTPAVLPKAEAEQMGRLHVLYNDRICPLETYALDFTKKLSGSRTYNGMSALEVLTGFMFYPEQWNREPVIRVKSKALRKQFGLGDYACINDFFSSGTYILGPMLQESTDAQKLDERIMLVFGLEYGRSLTLFPYQGHWYSPSDSLPKGIEHERAQYFRNALPMLMMYASQHNWQYFHEMAVKMEKYQRTFGVGTMPSRAQQWCEHVNNQVPFPTILFIVCLTMGILGMCQLMLRKGTAAKGETVQTATKGTSYRIHLSSFIFHLKDIFHLLSWVALTFALALRWIISGTIPMTNGYETMLFLAWVILLVGCLWGRRMTMLVPFTFIMAGFCLFVNHISQLDPQITPVMPVLNSPLLTLHVSIIMTAYALLTLTFVNSLAALLRQHSSTPHATTSSTLHTPSSTLHAQFSILLLYPAITCLAIGIFIGAVWANVSWGTYWQWDPKETWALITLLVYVVPLHPSLLSLKGKAYHVYIILAFLVLLMTYFGVNTFLTGMHSYA